MINRTEYGKTYFSPRKLDSVFENALSVSRGPLTPTIAVKSTKSTKRVTSIPAKRSQKR